jgi:hypothetical protein
MNPSQETHSTRQQEPRSDHPRAKGVWKGLLWLAVAVFAVAPFPWW